MSKVQSLQLHKSRRHLLFYAFAFSMVATFAFLLARDTNQSTAYTDGFRAGNIINDSTMRDYNSMSEADIQNFLKSKNSCNDTNLSKTGNNVGYLSQGSPYSWHIRDGHYVCMADESFDGESAAHIIYRAAQDYLINPKVLIVLLQKEQGLVTDTYPNSIQYRSATGYGCPDTAACDSQYYGIRNQIRNAASLFNSVLNGGWSNYNVGWNYIRYNPDASCGGSDVYIENRATAALYRYTPYQPNDGALAAGYGTSYCGAYGNRNFYSYYTDWFGSTQGTRWEPMLIPRVMTVKQGTLKVYPDTGGLDDNWLEPGRNLIFTSKTTFYRDGEPVTCLRTRIDTNANVNRCVLIIRLDEYTPTYSDLDSVNYYVSTFTCKVDLQYVNADCSQGLPLYTMLTAAKSVNINGQTYYILTDDYGKNNYGVLPQRLTKAASTFSEISPVYLRVVPGSSKYSLDLKDKVQILEDNSVVKFSSTITIDNILYYRTTFDANANFAKVVPASMLTSSLFANFLFPRDMVTNRNVDSIDPTTNQVCEKIAKDTKIHLDNKIYIGGKYYYHSSLDNNNCSIPADALREV